MNIIPEAFFLHPDTSGSPNSMDPDFSGDTPITRLNRLVYDQIASRFAIMHAEMTPRLAGSAERFLRLTVPSPRLLDLGCGPGRDLDWLQAHGAEVVGADLSMNMLLEARQRAHRPLIQADMTHLGFRAVAFDGIWCNASLLHLPKKMAPLVLTEMHRVLRPSGALFLAVKEGQGEAWETWSEDDHIQRYFARYSLNEMELLLVQSNFLVEEATQIGTKTNPWLHYFARKPLRP